MYEIFERLLKEKGVKAADVCRATGIKSPVFSEWKKGKSSPNVDKLILIAKFFGVSVEYLRTGKENQVHIEMVDSDTELLFLEQRLKEYAFKLAQLKKDDQECVMQMIDRLLQ